MLVVDIGSSLFNFIQLYSRFLDYISGGDGWQFEAVQEQGGERSPAFACYTANPTD